MSQPSGARGSMIMIAVFFVTALFGYMFNIALAWLLSATDYGIYGVATALLGILSTFILFGFPWAVVKFLSAEESLEKRLSTFKSALLGNFLVGLLVVALFFGLYSFLPPLAQIPAPVFFIMVSLIIIFSIRVIYLRALHGLMRFEQLGALNLLENGLRFITGLGLVYLGFNVAGALAGELIGGTISLLIAIYLLRDYKFWRSSGWIDIKILSFAWPMFWGMTGLTLLNQLDIIGLKFLGQEQPSQFIGYFQAAHLLAMIPPLLTGVLMGGVFPFISKYAREGGREYTLTAIKYVALFALPIAVALMLLPATFIKLFFPQEYSASADALRILALGGVFLSITQALANIYQALGQPALPAKALTVASVVEVILIFILVPRFHLNGAALAMVLANLIGATWLTLRLFRSYQLNLINRRLLKLAVSFLGLSLFLVSFPHGNWLFISLDVILSGLFYLFLLIMLRLVNTEDVDILSSALPQTPLIVAVTNKVKRTMLLFHKGS